MEDFCRSQEEALNELARVAPDAPFLAPVPYRGKRNEPAYTRFVAEKLVTITGRSLQEIEQLTTGNAERLFDLK